MYSVMLMAAMTAGAPEVPTFGYRVRWATSCLGSCSGYVVGYACSGCAGAACYGCIGGGCVGYYRPWPVVLWPRLRPFYWGVFRPGPVLVISGAPAPMALGAHVTPISGDVWGASYYPAGKTPFVPVAPKEEPKKPQSEPELKGTSRLILEVPTNAQVFIDGQETKSQSAVRYYHTPKLEEGQEYFYDVKVVIMSDGKVPSEMTRRIYVRANQIVREKFEFTSADTDVARQTSR